MEQLFDRMRQPHALLSAPGSPRTSEIEAQLPALLLDRLAEIRASE